MTDHELIAAVQARHVELREILERLQQYEDKEGSDSLQVDIDLLAAVLARLQGMAEPPTCETCKWNGGRFENLRICDNPDLPFCDVPFKLNGQPFGCAGHQAKESSQ